MSTAKRYVIGEVSRGRNPTIKCYFYFEIIQKTFDRSTKFIPDDNGILP